MNRDDLDVETYDWLTERFGERVAESLVPCPGHAWPLNADEQKTAHANYERWATQQEGDMSELSITEYEQDCKPLMSTPSAVDKLRSVIRRPFAYGVVDATDADVEVYATREDAIARARECHQKYTYIRPFRVVRISMRPISDDDEREVRERETLTERRAEEAERRQRAESEGTS